MTVEQVKFFKSLKAVRQRTSLLLKYPNHLQSFDVHLEKLPNVIDDIIKLIERDYKSPKDIPMHSRWRHFEAKPIAGTPNPGILEACSTRIQDLTGHWRNDLHIDEKEILRRLLDLSVVSVLLDAGAGPQWKYTAIHEGGTVYNRSEGLGIASLVWFNEGGFSSKPFQCDSNGLKNITVKGLETAFQVSSDNPLVGVEGRCKLLQNLGKVLENNPKYFGSENPRPGNLLDFLLTHKDTVKNESGHTIPLHCLWEVVVEGFSGVWPATRTKIDGISLGDVWPTKAMKLIHTKEKLSPEELKGDDENLVAFHKLSQWLTYSLLEPLALSGIHFTGTEDMTGLGMSEKIFNAK
ncbi:hypothetical protein HK099_008637 [Clydaea vesicula]|uniref:Uncharacterized protein n=1 Tax=Clydaea vesicula TaxID=447962 RepID=A0AAD5TX77_9FUNG|nr:hypothetical protein HK099_008637 [Clydaea vesicula]